MENRKMSLLLRRLSTVLHGFFYLAARLISEHCKVSLDLCHLVVSNSKFLFAPFIHSKCDVAVVVKS